MGAVRVVDPNSGTVTEIIGNGSAGDPAMVDLDHAIRDLKMHVLREDGSASRVQEFMGGLLVDGMPLQVVLGGPWLAGQREVLVPLIQSGKVPAPPDAVWNRGQVAMPEQVLQNTVNYAKANPASMTPVDFGSGGTLLAGVPNWMLLAGAGALLWYFMGSGGGRGSSQMELF